ncbi:recombinase family protein [Niallia sp. MER 6]|uniref:recombinase family protein n=1 Tax=Niallia sp. MER 6 TaxID=2939567 RepID=UPI00203A40AE|nr:recombinase family protein [Niallia sp. MER 6]MCM3030341.1 recombinase family protein [Niallia sp. MER 6]
MKAAIYTRVSKDEQFREGYSIESQKEHCISFTKSQKWLLYDTYVEEGVSAKNLNRPAIQALIADAKERKFEVVVFYKLDRLVRSVRDLDDLLKLFDENNIAIRSVTEPFDTTTAIGRFLITLVAAIAQWERETISERVVVNMTKKAMLGERNGGKPPFGYEYINGELVIKEEEARFVRDIFRLYNNGKGMRTIALFLNQFGIKKDIRTIGKMLDNPVYTGKLRWGNNSKLDVIVSDDIKHPTIIDENIFNLTQQYRRLRTVEGKKATSPFHFSGVLRCARCGSALSGYTKKSRGSKHYICIAKKNSGTCDLPMFTEKALTTEFFLNLSADDPERFFQLSQEDLKAHPIEQQDQSQKIEELKKELSAIKNRKKTWLMALGNQVISQDEYLEMTQEDTKKETILSEELNNIVEDYSPLDYESVISLLNNISDMWNSANDFEKKSFINELFETITVDIPSDYRRAPGKSPSVIIERFKLK